MIKDKIKLDLIEKFKKMPIVEVACKQIGISRASYYRWRKSHKTFAKEADDALTFGKQFINDLAESQLLQAIKDGNLTAIIFWLKYNNKNYGTKIEIKGRIKTETDKLTADQKKMIAKALELSAFNDLNNPNEKKEKTNPQNIS